MCSTFVGEALSISMTSREAPCAISRQLVHSQQGSGTTPWAQLSALAKIRAVVVLPFRGADEEVGMPDAVLQDGVLQGAGDVLLANDLAEALGPPLPGQYLIRHA